jgi:menaquinone-9 beta-reductase
MTPPDSTDIAIIGAGPAGNAAAYHLARAGHRVTILERSTFPRIKVCGEFISPAGTDALESILPARQLEALGAKRTRTMALILQSHQHTAPRRLEWQMPTPTWALSRATLDDALLRACRDAGATVLQPVAVREVAYFNDRATIHLSDGRSLDASIVIHADGSGRHDASHRPVPMIDGLLGHKCHLAIPPDQRHTLQGIEMRACPGAYVGTIELEAGLATCALAARRELIARFKDEDAMLSSLWPEYQPAWRTSDWKSSGVPRSRYITPSHPRSFRIGNAAAAVDPVGGEGIGLALWSGVTLAQLLAPALQSSPQSSAPTLATLTAIERRFASAYRRRLRTRLPACRLGAAVLMRPKLVRTLWPLLSIQGLAVGAWYALTGKGDVIVRPAHP